MAEEKGCISYENEHRQALPLQAEDGCCLACAPNSYLRCKYEAVFGYSIAMIKERTPTGVRSFMAAELGFEPRHTESESAVLPLHNSAMC